MKDSLLKRLFFSHSLKANRGLTLVEVVFSIAIFMIILGATAQGLTSFFGALELQEQRTVAAQNSRTVLGWLRQARDENVEAFPAGVVRRFPAETPLRNRAPLVTDGGKISRDAVDSNWPLPNQEVVVTYTDAEANPLEVSVVSRWTTLQGQSAQFTLTTLLTNQ